MRDDQMRELMRKAAATIPVEDPPHHDYDRREHDMTPIRRWFLPAAAAAAVAAILVGAVLLGTRATDGDGGTAASPGSTSPSAEPAPATPEEAAAAFVAFAEGGKSEVPWADEVTYYVGGAPSGTLTADEAADPQSWEGCGPDGTTYAGRDCPVSALRAVADLAAGGEEPVVEDTYPDVLGCERGAPPSDAPAADVAVVRPPATSRDCFSDFAVALYVDPAGQVVALNLQLSSP